MGNLFEIKVRVSKTPDNGRMMKVTESYLVDAVSFTEAETRIIRELAPFCTDIFVIAIKRSNATEVAQNSIGEKWYKVKVAYLLIDEKTGKEKKNKQTFFIPADSTAEAEEHTNLHFKGSMVDYEICDIVETPILDFYKYQVAEQSSDPSDDADKSEDADE